MNQQYKQRIFNLIPGVQIELEFFIPGYHSSQPGWWASISRSRDKNKNTFLTGVGCSKKEAIQNLRIRLAQATIKKLKGKDNE